MNSILIFGAGNTAKKITEYIDKRKNVILYYVDNDPEKQGKRLFGKTIVNPDIITDVASDYIIIASVHWREIRSQLVQMGIDMRKIRCPLSYVSIDKFKREYKNIYNIFGKMHFFYNKWHFAEQFNPDWMGVFVNPYFFSRRNLHKDLNKYVHYLSGKCLDFGCGIQPYKKMLPVEDYIGVEIETENKIKNIVYYDGHVLPFRDKEFDSIISSEVFEHVVNIEEILRELKRVLKDKGIMLVTVPFSYPRHCWPFDYRRYTSEGLRELMENAGFEIIEYKLSSNYQECLAQLKNVYWTEEVKTTTVIGRKICKIITVINNIGGIIRGKIMPFSDKLYLDNIFVVRKI